MVLSILFSENIIPGVGQWHIDTLGILLWVL